MPFEPHDRSSRVPIERSPADEDAAPTPPRARAGPDGTASHVVVRERLNARLASILEARAGEITGPPGSGKTTALREWASTIAPDVGWVTAEGRHRDERVLGRDLTQALAVGPATERADAAGIAEHITEALEREGRRAIVVIDDAERLDGAPSLELLRALVALEQDALRLVIAGRSIPDVGFEALRRRGALASITSSELRLERDEAAAVLHSVSGFKIDDQAVAAIHDHVGGWALGTVLAGLALHATDDPSAVAATSVSGHRYFDEYFGTEVFGRLPVDIQAFLLDTCVLTVLEPDLCGLLTDRTDAVEVLRGLERDNIFTDWIGGQPPGFRYHAVLRSWLRARLDAKHPTRALEQLRRAAEWAEKQERPSDAIEFRLAAGDVVEAETLIVAYGPTALGEGRYEAMRTWIGALPRRSVTASAPLLIMLADAEHRLGNAVAATAARALLRDLPAARAAGDLPDHRELTVVVQRGTELATRGWLLAAAAQARRARSMIDFTSAPVPGPVARFADLTLAMSVTSVAGQLMFVGDWEESVRISRWVVDAFPADDPRLATARSRCLGQIALVEVIEGSRSVGDDLAREAIALCRFYGLDPIDLGYAELALLVAAPGDVDLDALHRTIVRRGEQLDMPVHTCLIGLLRAWSYIRTGQVAAARHAFREAERSMASLPEPGMLTRLGRRVEAMVANGSDEPLLRARELEVLSALAAGRSRRQVAEELYLSVNTVKTYARQAYRKLGVHTLDEAVAHCESLGIALAISSASSTGADTQR